MRKLVFLVLAAVFGLGIGLVISCNDDDDDSGAGHADNADDDTLDADAQDDDAADDDAADDDTHNAWDGVVPTTLDATIVPVEEGGAWVLGEGPGEPYVVRNDFNVVPTRDSEGALSLSMGYFLSVADPQLVDEESPARLAFFDAWRLLFGMFESVFRPQEDLTPHQTNAIVRTANRLQKDYGRDFDFALILGDGADNAQNNELRLLIDILDGTGLVSGSDGWARPDSGRLDPDSETGRDRGERDFGAQQTDADGNVINPYERAGYPNSNADFPAEGLRRSDGNRLPWFFAIGNHDVLNNGGFVPGRLPGYFTRNDYIGSWSRFGYLPGIATVARRLRDDPEANIITWGGLYGFPVDWRSILWLMTFDPDWEKDIDPHFDLDLYLAGTPENPNDDGVAVAPDIGRAFLGREGLIPLFADLGHGFADNNRDGAVNATDGGWYRLDWNEATPGSSATIRVLVLDTMDSAIVSEGGIGTDQFAWLASELEQAVDDKVLVIIASHHPGESILVGGGRLADLLHGCPNVILHLVGHGHVNQIVPHPDPDGDPLRGYWEVQTPSICSFPQQARILEIVDRQDGTGVVYTTLFDHYPIKGDDADILATHGRDLGFGNYLQLGYEGGGFHGYGSPADRNAALIFGIPSDVADHLAENQGDGAVTSTDVLGTLYE